MKLTKLKQKLIENSYYAGKSKKRLIKKKREDFEFVDIDKIKIIGITGSRGKTTTALIVHEYLKSIGKKSVLYSSAKIDSPASLALPEAACESPLRNEGMLLGLIEEAEAYGAEYIVLEVNENAISRGLIENIPFSIRALTNIIEHHNDEVYTTEEYVRIKKSFLRNIPTEDDCICVFGPTECITKEDFDELLNSSNHSKVTFGSQYVSGLKKIDHTRLDVLLTDLEHNLNGQKFRMRIGHRTESFITNLILPHNAVNMGCALAILKALNVLDVKDFNKSIANIQIPGREELIAVKGRTIVIGMFLSPALEIFKQYKARSEINKIKVVYGAIGHGFFSWNKEFKDARYLNHLPEARRFDMNYVKKTADYIYLTKDDNAAEDPYESALELQNNLNDEIASEIITDRKEAIRKAILESDAGDIIYIAGRGNKKMLCDSANTFQLFTDRNVVEEVLKELK